MEGKTIDSGGKKDDPPRKPQHLYVAVIDSGGKVKTR
jgi:hypothetical protein